MRISTLQRFPEVEQKGQKCGIFLTRLNSRHCDGCTTDREETPASHPNYAAVTQRLNQTTITSI